MVTFLEILGSLGVFLYGMKILSEGIQRIADAIAIHAVVDELAFLSGDLGRQGASTGSSSPPIENPAIHDFTSATPCAVAV